MENSARHPPARIFRERYRDDIGEGEQGAGSCRCAHCARAPEAQGATRPNPICGALGLEAQGPASEPQASVHFEAAAGKEIVLEYKQHGMSDFLGPT